MLPKFFFLFFLQSVLFYSSVSFMGILCARSPASLSMEVTAIGIAFVIVGGALHSNLMAVLLISSSTDHGGLCFDSSVTVG